MLYSFDVFDTVLMRKVYEPAGIFSVMSFVLKTYYCEWGLSFDFVSDFRWIRMNAERQARIENDREITLQDIYSIIRKNYCISSENVVNLMNLEVETELDNCIPIYSNIDKILDLIASGNDVIFISDMYLPLTFFKRIFDKLCPELNEIDLYLSSEIGLTKASGLLYEYIMKKKNIGYSDWTHVGDNVVSDVNVPQAFGIKADHFQIKYNSRWMSVIKNMNYPDDIIKQYIMGALLHKNSAEELSNPYIIGYFFAGIILYSYVCWILIHACNNDIKHLYFIARDGYILKEIADILIQDLQIDIVTHYLYGSREAWRVDDHESIQLLYKYFKQEIDICEEYAFVDTHGTGKSIDSVSKIIGSRIKVYYYDLIEPVRDKMIDPVVYSSNTGSLIEVLCRAPHGSTIGYVCKNGKVEPVLQNISETMWKRTGLFEYSKGTIDFCREFSEINRKFGNTIPLMAYASNMLEYCTKTPDIEVANFIGDIPFDIDNNENERLFAPMLNSDLIKKIEIECTNQKLSEIYPGYKIDYSYKRLSKADLDSIKEYKKKFYSKTIKKVQGATQIIIYGYGEYGRELYHRLFKNHKINVKAIVDINHQRCSNELVRVSPISIIKETEYDYIVITMTNKKTQEQVKNMLIALGVDSRKIISSEILEAKIIVQM